MRIATAQPQVLSEVLGVVYRAISTFLIKKTGFTVTSGAAELTQLLHAISKRVARVSGAVGESRSTAIGPSRCYRLLSFLARRIR